MKILKYIALALVSTTFAFAQDAAPAEGAADGSKTSSFNTPYGKVDVKVTPSADGPAFSVTVTPTTANNGDALKAAFKAMIAQYPEAEAQLISILAALNAASSDIAKNAEAPLTVDMKITTDESGNMQIAVNTKIGDQTIVSNTNTTVDENGNFITTGTMDVTDASGATTSNAVNTRMDAQMAKTTGSVGEEGKGFGDRPVNFVTPADIFIEYPVDSIDPIPDETQIVSGAAPTFT